MAKVTIYPAFDAFYYSFYIKGIVDVFGRSQVKFSYKGFPCLSSSNCLAFVLRTKANREMRMVIDAYDGASISGFGAQTALAWCDVYGKVNLVSEVVPPNLVHKCIAIGPSFPICIWPTLEAWRRALLGYRPAIGGYNATYEYFANYRRQYKYRLQLEHFMPGLTKDNYIFFSSSIWNEEEVEKTNEYRQLFMKSAKSFDNIIFEGGFSPPGSLDVAAKYQGHIASKRYSLSEWLEKTKSSMVAFNTPAVWLSHTFKLAEYLALGKAIISTPLSRELPAPLVHGEDMHYVDGSADSMRAAIELLSRDRKYRNRLEKNAHAYYKKWLTPHRVIERLVAFGPGSSRQSVRCGESAALSCRVD